MRGKRLAIALGLLALSLSAGFLAATANETPEVSVGNTGTESTARLDTEISPALPTR